VNKQIDQILSGATVEESGQRISDSTLAMAVTGPTTDGQMNYRSPPLSAHLDHDPAGHSEMIHTSPSRHLTLADMAPSTAAYQLPSNAFVLLEYYFSFTHSWLPMTEKHNMLKILYSYPPDGLPFNQVNTAEHSELWSIIALTMTQVADTTDLSDIDQVRRNADSLLPAGNLEVPHIRALILRALDDYQRHELLSAWLRLGSAVRTLHLFRLLENLGKTAKYCRHVHLVAFVVESTLARRLQTVPHFRTDYIKAFGFIDEDGLDEWEGWSDPLNASAIQGVARTPTRACSTLNELVRYHIRLMEDYTVSPRFEGTPSDLDGSILCLLLRNAMSKSQRMQPSDVVTAFCKSANGRTLNWTSIARPGE
jgi:hypothetical protein